MTSTLKKIFLVTLLLLCMFHHTNAQESNQEAIDKLKNGYTHIVVDTTDFRDADEFLKVFKENWTVTKGVSYLNRSELKDNLVAGDTYCSLELVVTDTGHGFSTTFYLMLWSLGDDFGKKKWPLLMRDQKQIYRIDIASDKEGTRFSFYVGPKLLSRKLGFDFNGSGHLFNWNAGHLKNGLQRMTKKFAGEKVTNPEGISTGSELQRLKTDTLWLTPDAFHKSGTFTGDGKQIDTVGLFKKYKFAYKVVEPAVLKEKILHATAPFYHFMVISTGGSKTTKVVNGLTGRVIYGEFYNFSMNLKSDDFEDLSKAIEKGKQL